MGKFSTTNLHGMTIRESATDGSDFTNPDADYRRLFLGEDGALHLKDSAGSVTDTGGGSGDVATDAIWDAPGDTVVGTGADTAARLAKGAAGGFYSIIDGAVAWNSGTSFPGSPDTGDRYYRTDIEGGMSFMYDGTRWVSEQLFVTDLSLLSTVFGGLAQSGAAVTIARGTVPWASTRDIFLVDWRCSTFVSTTNNGTHFWTLSLQRSPAAPSFTTIDSFTTAADTASNFVYHEEALDAVLDSNATVLIVSAIDTDTPGNLVVHTNEVTYRLIAT